MLKDLVKKNRSYRRFYQEKKVLIETLRELVDLARLSACGANKQNLRFILANESEKYKAIDENVFWAGYYTDWAGPIEGEKPSAYIVIVKDITNGKGTPQDEGIAAQSILLGAVEKSMGGCMIGNINRKDLQNELQLDDKYEIALVVAIGYPKETVIIDEISIDGDIKYWRDENDAHHVPKRKLADLIL